MRRVSGAVRLAKRMPTGDQRNRFFTVHRHAAKRLLDIVGRKERVRVAVRPFGVYVDQTHLRRTKWILENAAVHTAIGIHIVVGHKSTDLLVSAFGPGLVTYITAEPCIFGAPVDVQIRLPYVRAPTAETERFEAHSFERNVAREDHQVGPGDLSAVLL